MKLEADFSANGEIPREHTSDGADTPPPLRWSGVPAGAKSLALIVDDPDAPDPRAPKTTWVHWVVYDLEKKKEGLNDWKRTGWGGPAPPIGRHRYFFKLYALDTELSFAKAPSKHDLEQAMKGHILAQTELVGTYQKAG